MARRSRGASRPQVSSWPPVVFLCIDRLRPLFRPPAIPPPPATAVTSSVPSKVREELQEVMTSIWGKGLCKGQGKKIDKSKKFYAKFVQTYHAFMIHEFWTKLKN